MKVGFVRKVPQHSNLWWVYPDLKLLKNSQGILTAPTQETCEGKVAQLYSGVCYEQLVKNGVDSSSTTGGDPETLASATQISHISSCCAN